MLVNPKNTSIKCSSCAHTDSRNRKSRGEFECLSCGHAENADLNASKNILAEGHSVIGKWSGSVGFHGEAGTPDTKACTGISWRIPLL